MRVLLKILVSFVLGILFSGWLNPAESRGQEAARTSFWLYQLQHPRIDSIVQSGFSRVVIDYSRDGTDKRRFSSKDIHQLIQKGLVPIAYLSVGEAENYRFYWDPRWLKKGALSPKAPKWLGRNNPDWEGNHKVRYWNSDWRDNYLKPYLEKILNAGFMGVYLDIVDAFEYWSDPDIYLAGEEARAPDDPVDDEEEAAKRMIDLILWVARFCREHSPYGSDFLIFPQNGERLLLYDEEGSLLNAISGIGVEDLWYQRTHRTPIKFQKERLPFLNKLAKKGKWVLSVDYVDNGNHKSKRNISRIQTYLKKCREHGFYCYAGRSDVQLNIINRIPGLQP